MENQQLEISHAPDLLTLKEASLWASNWLNKTITPANISYLIQYGRIKKMGDSGNSLVSLHDLKEYYKASVREADWKKKLGNDLNWALSFDKFKESETTKHVHRLHPYKGKFIPQLVEYFLDSHTDEFKKEVFFNKGDIILDPFAGSGTTLVQANELGMHALGVDISAFNSLISNVKLTKYDFYDVKYNINIITESLNMFLVNAHYIEFEKELLGELNLFNSKYFPVPDYKYSLNRQEIDEEKYGLEKESVFLETYLNLLEKHQIKLTSDNKDSYLSKWYFPHIIEEINLVFDKIKNIQNINTKKLLSIILSRTIRSCRATKHADLATLFEPITTTYYCSKHGKICKPIFTILKWWKTYSKDTLQRIAEFDKLKTKTNQLCLTGDSRNIDLVEVLKNKNLTFHTLLQNQKIAGIFSSPPYVGLIDYHEQHAYAYELFGFERKDEYEIGPLFKGQGRSAQESYVQGISEVLLNFKKYFINDYNVFLVSNDKYNLYQKIAEKANMKIISQFKRPVLNRTEKDKGAYSEIIFHMKENN